MFGFYKLINREHCRNNIQILARNNAYEINWKSFYEAHVKYMRLNGYSTLSYKNSCVNFDANSKQNGSFIFPQNADAQKWKG